MKKFQDKPGQEPLSGQTQQRRNPASGIVREIEFYQRILDSMEDGVYVVDPDYNIVYINSALKNEFGPVDNRKCYRYFHDRRSACPWCKNSVVFTGKPVRWEWYSFKNRKTYDLLDTPLHDARGRPLKLEIFRDITQGKNTERSLRESEERFRMAFEAVPNAITISQIDTGVLVDVNAGFRALTGYTKEEAVGRSSLEIPIWKDPAQRDSLIDMLKQQGAADNFEGELIHRDGEIKTCLISVRNLRLGRRPYMLSVAQDISDRKKDQRKLQASHRFLQIANRHSKMQPLLEEFVDELQTLSGCEAVGVRILSPQGKEIPFLAHTGFSERFIEQESPLSPGKHDTLCTRVLRGRSRPHRSCFTARGSFFINDLAAAADALGEAPPCGTCIRSGYTSLALIPIRGAGRVSGLIHLADGSANRLPLDRVVLIEEAAMQLAAAIRRVEAEEALRRSNEELERRVEKRTAALAAANRRLLREIEERRQIETAMRQSRRDLRMLSARLMCAEETERRRIARELHDGIGQALGAIKYGIENTLRSLEKKLDDSSVRPLESIAAFAADTIEDVRRIVNDLHPSSLEDLGILATIRWFCRKFQTLYSEIRISTQLTVKEESIPQPLKTVLYRILQEALNNVVKHSRADRVNLRLECVDETLMFTIADNGAGLEGNAGPDSKKSCGGFGLASMRERTEMTGGTFSIGSQTGEGTIIRAAWPQGRIEEPCS